MEVTSEIYKGYRITIKYDQDCENPFEDRECWPDGLAIVHNSSRTVSILDGELDCEDFHNMIEEEPEQHFMNQYGSDCWIIEGEDGKWRIFANPDDSTPIFTSTEGLTEGEAWNQACKEFSYPCEDDFYWLPVYKYDHSGIRYNTTGFACHWDSDLFGYIYINKDLAEKEWPTEEAAVKFMEGAVDTWSSWASGDCYGFVIEEEVSCTCGEHTEWREIEDGSCWGFLGDMEYCLAEARNRVDTITEGGEA